MSLLGRGLCASLLFMPWWHWLMASTAAQCVCGQPALFEPPECLVTTAGYIGRDRFPWVAVAALSALSTICAHTLELHTLQAAAVSLCVHILRFAAGSGT